ncbi:MAG: hypothetical protein JNK05_11435 [Myxococcales bacterium]|nr:hypothetical protein [Myxococcales bacterium]
MTDPTRRVAGPTGPSPSAQASKTTHNPQRSTSFREALDEAQRKRAKPSERKRPASKDDGPRADRATSPLLAQTDGTLVVGNPALAGAQGFAALLGATGERAPRASASRAGAHNPLENQGQTEARALAIEHVRVGRAGETVRVHATLGEGEHKGVELRAVERNGKIEVELVAQDSVSAERLRSEMSGVRDTLDAAGNERVAVSVIDASAKGAETGERPRDEGSRQEHPHDDRREGDQQDREGATETEGEPLEEPEAARSQRWRLL